METQSTDAMSGAAAAGLGIGSIIFLLLILAIMIVPLWKIFEKTGRHGAMSLLMIVPIVNLFVLPFLAFGKWPRFDR
jgi:hypothetical protein